MLTAEQYLDLVNKRGQDGKPLKRVYANMLKLDFFINAYGKLYRNKGALTKGVDGKTVDGTSLKKLEVLIEELRTRQFEWTPVRRSYLTKKEGKKKRPLGIPAWRDKIVAEVIRVILEAYYEPQFSNLSHAYRPNRGCHTALDQVTKWRGTKWWIEGDITGCFDNLNHKILLQTMGKDIQDRSFLNLIEGMLKAGYLEDWTYHRTYSGAPQGGIASPILSNIYLKEMDRMIEKELNEWNKGKSRKQNPEYHRRYKKARRAFKQGNTKEGKRLMAEARKYPPKDVYDPAYRRLRYVRYADDVLLGFIGTYQEAVQIKERLKQYLLKKLDLELNDEKTYITQASQKPARFLGYDIQCPVIRENKRCMTGRVVLRIPKSVINDWTGRYSRNGKPIHRSERMHQSDYEIVSQFGAEFRGLFNYYKYALNVRQLNRVKYTMSSSLVKTLAAKHQTNPAKIYSKHKFTDETYGIEATSEEGPRATFGGYSLTRRKVIETINDNIAWTYYGRSELARRLAADVCEIEGCTNNAVEGHHIKALKNLKKRWKGRKDKPEWVKFMITRNRKVIMVCNYHHHQIHSGLYDGPKLVGKH